MKPSDIRPGAARPARSEQRRGAWQTPAVSRLRAGAAELGFDNLVSDDAFSYS